MSEPRRRTPRQKKQDEYDRDHHHPNSHGFWRDWRKEKARRSRFARRQAARVERAGRAAADDPEAFEDSERRAVFRDNRLTRGFTPSVRERVRTQREAKLWRTGRGAHGVRGRTARWLDAYFAADPRQKAAFERWTVTVGGGREAGDHDD